MSLPDTLAGLLDFNTQTLRVSNRESKKLELKQSFVRTQLPQYERTMAAFANTTGGTIVFGVDDNPRLIVGTDPAAIADPADISVILKQDFSPELPFEMKSYQVGALTVLAICVEPAIDRPVICQRTRSVTVPNNQGGTHTKPAIDEAVIYYRYMAHTAAIRFTELKALLDAREERRLRIIMDTIKAVERVGINKAAVVDVSAYNDPDKATNLYVSRETARSLNFIDKGRFTETPGDGSPAYMVVGQVKLAEAVRAPLEEVDKNLPGETATKLAPLVAELYGAGTPMGAGMVSALLTEFGLVDMPYQEYDAKLKRRYITRSGIEAIEAKMQAEPLRALTCFSSAKRIKAYEDAHPAIAQA